MKNLKNIIATLVLVGGLGVSNSFAGLLVSDFGGGTPQQCEQPAGDWLTGIIVSDLTGIIVSDILGYENTNDCTNTSSLTGLIVSD